VQERGLASPSVHRIVHYWKDETVSSWQRGIVLSEAAAGPASLFQGPVQDSGQHGNFEAVILEGSQLVHYWRDNSQPDHPWHRGNVISVNATGPGCIIASHFGSVGNFEVLVPEGKHLQHYWHPNEGPAGTPGERFYFRQTFGPTMKVKDPYP